MALHAKLLKHNILRVSKLKKLSHTTQAIERKYDGNATLCSTHLKQGGAEEAKTNCASYKEDTGLWSSSSFTTVPPSPDGSLLTVSRLLPMDLLEIFSYQAQQFPTSSVSNVCQDKVHCHTSCPNLNIITGQSVEQAEKSFITSLSPALFPLENLPSVAKPISYTTDDIITCPTDRNGRSDARIVSCDNDLVAVLIERQTAVWNSSFTNTNFLPGKDTQPDATTAAKPGLKGHYICDSNSSLCGTQCTDMDANVLLCSTSGGSDPHSQSVQFSQGAPGSTGEKGQGPNLDQLRTVETYFIETLPHFFKSRLEYRIYHPNITFENNFWGQNEVSEGINQYAIQMVKMRAMTHMKFAHVHMEVVSSQCVAEEGLVRVQWRIRGISQLKALRFWRYTAWSYNKSFKEDAEWMGGVSTLHVNKEGLVTKHRMDRVTPDEGQALKSPTLAVKLALLLGLAVPKPSMSGFSSLLCRQ